MRENQENWAMNLVELEMSKNDITGDKIISKKNSTDYTDNFEGIFRKRKQEIDEQLAEAEVEDFKENDDVRKQ